LDDLELLVAKCISGFTHFVITLIIRADSTALDVVMDVNRVHSLLLTCASDKRHRVLHLRLSALRKRFWWDNGYVRGV
jgi:hypothetical protein